MVGVTLYSLFFDDLRVLVTPKSADDYFFGVSTFALVIFAVEILLQCFAFQGYLGNFFFWLDLVATMSMVSDIDWIWTMIDSASTGTGSNAATLAKTARAGRITRVIRIIRLIRIVRIVKIYKQAKLAARLSWEKKQKLLEKQKNEEIQKMRRNAIRERRVSTF